MTLTSAAGPSSTDPSAVGPAAGSRPGPAAVSPDGRAGASPGPDTSSGGPAGAPPGPAADGRQRGFDRKWVIVGAAALALILVVALILAAIERGGDRVGQGRGGHVVTGPVGNRAEATIELLTGATSVTVRAADLGGHLYEVRTPAGSRQIPLVSESAGVVHVELGDSGEGGPSAVEIVLGTATTWRVRLVAGATNDRVDLTGAKVSGVEFVGGVGSIDLILPRPAGTVEVRMTGGTGSWVTRRPGDVPVQVVAGSGAGAVTIDGTRQNGVAAGTTITGDGWDSATDRYDLVATGGMSSLTVDRR